MERPVLQRVDRDAHAPLLHFQPAVFKKPRLAPKRCRPSVPGQVEALKIRHSNRSIRSNFLDHELMAQLATPEARAPMAKPGLEMLRRLPVHLRLHAIEQFDGLAVPGICWRRPAVRRRVRSDYRLVRGKLDCFGHNPRQLLRLVRLELAGRRTARTGRPRATGHGCEKDPADRKGAPPREFRSPHACLIDYAARRPRPKATRRREGPVWRHPQPKPLTGRKGPKMGGVIRR